MGDDAGAEASAPKAKKRKLQGRAKETAAESVAPETGSEATKRKTKGRKSAGAASEDTPVDSVTPLAKQGKKRKRKEADSITPPVKEAAKSGLQRKAQKKKRKAEAKDGAQESDQDPRKVAQREIQQLVMKLRAEGKSKHEIEAAKWALKQKYGGSLQQADSSRAKKTEAWKQKVATEEGKSEAELKRKKALEHKHDVVVIPVIWRGRHDHQAIMAATEDVKALLAQQGIDAWVDSRRHYTPGQKFAHWEYRGVMLRIEIGPEDFQSGMLKICRAKEPGDYKSVDKKRVRLPPAGTRGILLALKEWGLDKIDIDRRDGDSAEEEEPGDVPVQSAAKAGANKAKLVGAEKDVEDDLEGNWAPRKAPVKDKKKKGLRQKK